MDSKKLPICTACGSQFDCKPGQTLTNCKICDDPRQFVPGIGQTWTTLEELRKTRKNEWKQDSVDKEVWTITTEPKFAINQHAFFIETPNGNIMWDMIAFLDQETIDAIKAKGGLKAIIVSHPHYYTTYVEWAEAFGCPIWVGSDDQEWLCRQPPKPEILQLIQGPAGASEIVIPGVTAIKAGGHFPGSLLLLYKELLFIADTFITVPSAYTPHPRPKGQTSYGFMYSIPNMIPLSASEMLSVWRAVEPFNFNVTHGAFEGMKVRGKDVKRRVLESMQIQSKSEGWVDHEIMKLELPPFEGV